jgi:hypothetical protein
MGADQPGSATPKAQGHQADKLSFEIEKLFRMVYMWGRVGIVVDENAPAFRTSLKDLVLVATDHISMTPDERHMLFDKLMQVTELPVALNVPQTKGTTEFKYYDLPPTLPDTRNTV